MAKRRRRRRRGRSGRRRRRGARRGEETGISGWLVGHRPTVYTRTVRSVARVQDHNAISTVGSNCRGRERAYFAWPRGKSAASARLNSSGIPRYICRCSRARCVYIRRRNPSPFIPLLSLSLSPSPLHPRILPCWPLAESCSPTASLGL